MPEKRRNLVTEVEFGSELAGQRVGWSTVTGYGRRSDEILAVHIAMATVGEEGASFEYESREHEGKPIKAFWSDAAKGFVAMAGISVVVDRTRSPKDQERIGPYYVFDDDLIRGSSEGRPLRTAGGAAESIDELDEKRSWLEGAGEIISSVKENMRQADLTDYYPNVYYTANMLLGHEQSNRGSSLGKVAVEDVLLPDSDMHVATVQEIHVASTIERALSAEHTEDGKMLRNLSVFGDIPTEDIPSAFRASRIKVAKSEQSAVAAKKQLYTQAGIFLPIGFHGGRSWPYMSADLPLDDERAFGRELRGLEHGKTKLAESELEREIEEIEARARHASQGVNALELLSRGEATLVK